MSDAADGDDSTRRIAALILAAGASTRLGQPKQLLRLDGESLLRRTARVAIDSGCAPVFVVLGYAAQQMQAELNGLPATALINENWTEGMGSSLRCGMAAVTRSQPSPQAVLLLVCDQPRLTVEHLQTLLHRHKTGNAPITASFYAQRDGVPAVLAASLFPDLLACSADRGARDLIRSHADRVQRIPWPEGELDLDRPQDLAKLPQK
ncbi:MAG: nucleotidyltransferase family protein [Acidobacteriaceae bacterium]